MHWPTLCVRIIRVDVRIRAAAGDPVATLTVQ